MERAIKYLRDNTGLMFSVKAELIIGLDNHGNPYMIKALSNGKYLISYLGLKITYGMSLDQCVSFING